MKNPKILRMLCLALILSAVLSLLISCGSDRPDGSLTDTDASGTENPGPDGTAGPGTQPEAPTDADGAQAETQPDATDGGTVTDGPTDEQTTEEPEMSRTVFSREPIPCENITINAYLVPLQDEVRDRTLALCRDADVDVLSHVYFAPHWVFEDHTYGNYKKLMADASAYGLPVFTRDTDLQNCLSLTDEQIVGLAGSYADLPGFGGFFVVDEPVNPDVFARVENDLRKVCPDCRTNINFLPRSCYPEGVFIRQLTDYGGLLDRAGWLSLDVYCFGLDGGVNEYELFNNYNDIRVAGLKTGCNTAVYVQSVGMEGGYRRPTANDLRYNMMAAVAYGVKELKFFCWGTPPTEEGSYSEAIIGRDYEPTDLYEPVCAINKKIHALGRTLAKCDALCVYHSKRSTRNAYEVIPEDLFVQVNSRSGVILSLMKQRGGDAEYVTVVNKSLSRRENVTLTFAAGIEEVSVLDGVTGEPVPMTLTDGKLVLTLEPGDAAVICLPEGRWFPCDNAGEPAANVNIALGKPVFGNSSAGTGGYYLYNLTDGVLSGDGTRLSSDDGGDRWVYVDLCGQFSFNRVELYPAGSGRTCGARNPRAFTLSVSTDGADWTDVYTCNGEPLSREFVTVITFETVRAEFVRLTVTDMDGTVNSADIGEMAVYLDDGTMPDKIPTDYEPAPLEENADYALNKPVVSWSSTTDVPEWTCHHDFLTDGNDRTAWASELFRNDSPDSEEWIVVDLCDIYRINRVVLTPRDLNQGSNGFPADYEIAVSSDGKNFTTVCSVTGDNDPISQEKRVLTFDTVAARYVMLKATRLSYDAADGKYMIEISEMEVYGE